MAVALLWTGCEGRDDIDPKQGNPFTLSICLPADEVRVAPKNGPNRVMGDPGTTEVMELPKYIYIFIINKVKPDEEDWRLFDTITIGDATEHWNKEYYTGSLMGSGDSIYRYTRDIAKQLSPSQKFAGRIYAIASAKKLTFNTSLTSGTSTEEQVLELKFQTSGDMQANLQHIYSTPYNYEINDEYYGSFNSDLHNVPYINLMLYHVAAKVDINWFVAENKRIDRETPANAVRLTSMKACNLFNGDAYCFKPMENKQATKLNPSAGTGDTITMVTPSDMGLWWEGRSYFYTIPYTLSSGANQSHYPLQMQMETNESGAIYKPTVYLEVNTSSPFVPWLRATFNINNPLAAGTAEKTVSL